MCLFETLFTIKRFVMFRKKNANKAKLEHKLYLARENPEPIFDLSECDLQNVPSGVYSLCRVFLKESLRLENNCLSSLSGGGSLKDLHFLKILNLSHNSFHSLPDDIHLLTNLKEFYLIHNKIKKLNENICKMASLQILDVSHNLLKSLPEEIGGLTNLRKLDIQGNKINTLPKTINKCRKMKVLDMDKVGFEYPPLAIVEAGVDCIMEFICSDLGVPYSSMDQEDDVDNKIEVENEDNDSLQAKIWELENIKQQRVKEFLEIERNNEFLQKQELELAQASKLNRVKLLAELTEQQTHFDVELNRIQQRKESERFSLIEQLQEAENNADIAIKQLLALNGEPQAQLLEQERQEEERLLAAVNRYNETLRKDDILAAMQDILEQETVKFKQFHQSRIDTTQSILEQEMETDSALIHVLQNQDEHKIELVNALIKDNDLQRAAVAALLERGDARSWGLLQQIKLVESQLAMLTVIELDKKKLHMDQQMNDLCDKRVNLSMLLIDLLEQQKSRRAQLISTLQSMEESNNDRSEDFWLKQYQILLDKLPEGLSQAQKDINPTLAQALLVNGVIHCLPFLAKLTQGQCDIRYITDQDLKEACITSSSDRKSILNAFCLYEKENEIQDVGIPKASAPPLPVQEEEEEVAASAPLPANIKAICYSECVICLDLECQIIFVPCGHFCCCCQCSTTLLECPLCRSAIDRKIALYR